jgi:hypothetical protein
MKPVSKNIKPSLAKSRKNSSLANTKKTILSKALKEEFIHFITHCPANRFSRNLRSMLLEFLLASGGEAPYLKDLVIDLESLFCLLDAVEMQLTTETQGRYEGLPSRQAGAKDFMRSPDSKLVGEAYALSRTQHQPRRGDLRSCGC